MSKDNGGGEQEGFHYEHGVPVFDASDQEKLEQDAAKKRDEEHKEEQLRLNRSIARFTAVLAICTIITGGISVWQADVAQHSANAAEVSAQAAKAAADIAELSQRPWIKIVNVKTRGDSTTIPALSFNGFGHGPFPNSYKSATVQLDVSLKNIGHSVADVYVDYDLFLPAWDSEQYFKMVQTEQRIFCSDSRKVEHFPLKFVVFPDEPLQQDGSVTTPQIIPGSINHIPGHKEGVVLPVVIVCVDYRLPNSSKVYQSSVVYEAFRSEDRSRFFPVGIDVPADKIVLQRNPAADEAH